MEDLKSKNRLQIYIFAANHQTCGSKPFTLNRNQILGFIFVVISAICFSSKGVLIKLAYVEHIDAISLLTFRMLFSFPFFAGIAIADIFKKQPVATDKKDLILVIFLGLIGYYLSSLLDFYGLEYISAGLERLILFIYPTMVAILAAIFFKKSITKPMVISLLITYAGILLVVIYDITIKGSGLYLGIALIFLCAVLFSIYLVFSDSLVHKFGSVRYTSYIMLTSSIGVFAHFLIEKDISTLFNYSPKVYYLAIILAVFGTVIPSYLMTDGIKKIGARNTSITATLGPVWTIIFAYIVLQEEINFVQIAGTILVVTGVLIANLNKS